MPKVNIKAENIAKTLLKHFLHNFLSLSPTLTMVTSNFQIKPRICKYHQLYEEFICVNAKCQYRGLMCSDCSKEGHSDHFHDVKTVDKYISLFNKEVSEQEQLFEKDKIVINIKEIVKSKVSQLDQALNEIMVKVVKMLDQEKETLLERLRELECTYASKEIDYKASLEMRYDCLEYLSEYKNDSTALKAKLACSSEWGVVSLKNCLSDLKNHSLNRSRNVNFLTDTILEEADKMLKNDSFLYSIKGLIEEFSGSILAKGGACSSFIEKSILTNNTKHTNSNQQQTPQSSRVLNSSRSRVHSLAGIRHVSSNQSIEGRTPSLERIPKMPSETNLGSDRYLRGLNRYNLSRVIIK